MSKVDPSSTGRVDHVSGLDSVRFLCALWVFFGHGGVPDHLWNPFAAGSRPYLAERLFYGNLWVGPAAVLVFFVISGFCIHFPFAGSERHPRLAEFYARRFLRILIPVLAAIPLGAAMGVKLTFFQDSVLWSLLAEMIYYVLYPGLRVLQIRWRSWTGMIVFSFFAALAVAATKPTAGDYPSYGPGLNWLLGLPCWLLGCALAEVVRTRPGGPVSTASVWRWRAGVLFAAWGCSVMRFHTPLVFPWTLNFFALFVACWLWREIQFRREIAPPAILEWAGAWSYSLYLIHLPAKIFFEKYTHGFLSEAILWMGRALFVLVASYLFYLLVERPSHRLARRVARSLRGREVSPS